MPVFQKKLSKLTSRVRKSLNSQLFYVNFRTKVNTSNPSQPPFLHRLPGIQRLAKVRPIPHPVALVGFGFAFLFHLLFLSPSSLELAVDAHPVATEQVLESLLPKGRVIAPNLPNQFSPSLAERLNSRQESEDGSGSSVPDYSVKGFSYLATKGGLKQWKILAELANVYQKSDLIHGIDVVAYIYENNGKTTVVEAHEALLTITPKILELFQSVKSKFPDGFTTISEYMLYQAGGKGIHVPATFLVRSFGEDTETSRKIFSESYGMEYLPNELKLILPSRVKVTVQDPPQTKNPKTTIIESDRAEINRATKQAYFMMNENRPSDERYVLTSQPPGFYMRSRTAEMRYGTIESDKTQSAVGPNTLVAIGDVLFRELPEEASKRTLRYGTAGRAEFHRAKNELILTEYPQVYQEEDTVTGNRIIVHRNTGLVEVDQSNAYSAGKSETGKPPSEGN